MRAETNNYEKYSGMNINARDFVNKEYWAHILRTTCGAVILMVPQYMVLSYPELLKVHTQSILADILSGAKVCRFNVPKTFLNAQRLTLGGHTQK